MTQAVSKQGLRILVTSALLVAGSSGVLWADPQDAADTQARRERARQLLAECMQASDPVLLKARAKAAQRLFAEAGDPLGEGLSLLTIASVEVLEGNLDAGRAAFDRATELATASGDVFSTAVVHIAEAATWRSVKRYDEAAAILRECLRELQRQEGEDVDLSLDFMRYFAPQQFPAEALEQVDSYLELLKPVLLQSLQSTVWMEMAGIHREQGSLEEALKALERAQALQDPLLGGVDAILVERGEVEGTLGRSARALELYESALAQARNRGDLALQARILRGLADVHEREGRHEQAAEYRERAAALMPQPPRP